MDEDRINDSNYQKNTEKDYKCPTCDVVLKSDEFKTHCEVEVNRLTRLKKPNVNDIFKTCDVERLSKTDKSCPWWIFQKVQRNRQLRCELRSRKRPQIDIKCPICSAQVNRDINGHLDKCLKLSNNRSEPTNNDDSMHNNSEVYEEYEWAGQKRIRVSSLLQGGYASIGIGTIISNEDSEDDEDLNVDEDDTKVYGPPQYSENDVICPESSKYDATRTSYMNGFLQDTNGVSNLEPASSPANPTNSCQQEINEDDTDKSSQHVINSLKMRLRQLENHSQNKFKCLICLDEYHNPAISVSCWHVHCEECWLRSLGARKLCPQCNLITSPSDLRRIYM